jgi:hypothetical protein
MRPVELWSGKAAALQKRAAGSPSRLRKRGTDPDGRGEPLPYDDEHCKEAGRGKPLPYNLLVNDYYCRVM